MCPFHATERPLPNPTPTLVGLHIGDEPGAPVPCD